jgi:hypothetical protein
MHVKKIPGPKTSEGIAISSQNAVTHGMTSTLILIKGESQADLDNHFHQWHLQYPTTNEIAERLVTRAALSEWHLLRHERQYNTVSSQLLETPITDWTDANHALYKNIQRYLTAAQRAHHRDRLNIQQQYRAEIRSEQSQKNHMETSKASEISDPDTGSSSKLFQSMLNGNWPRIEGPVYQDITLKNDENAQPWVNIVPTTEQLLRNTDNSYETTEFIRRIELQDQPVAPGYEWVAELFKKAPGAVQLWLHMTAKSLRIAAERENGGPIQRWLDLEAIDKPILDSKVKGPPCLPRESK